MMGWILAVLVGLVSGEEPSCLIQVKEEQAAPSEYVYQMTDAVRQLVKKKHRKKHKVPEMCGPNISGQKMYFAGPDRCSVASADMVYLAHDGNMTPAKKGDIIEMNCDDVFCPIPFIADCYMSPGICKEDEWCWIRQHEKWGAWAMGPLPNGTFGHSPEPDYCAQYLPAYEAAVAKANGDQRIIRELNRSLELLCPNSSQVFSKDAWRPIRGQCVPYRKEQQSCFQEQDLSPAFTGSLTPRYKLDKQGFPMERPLACAPNLTCTAPNFNVLPSTCVQKRPKDICFYGPWWDSSDCPRSHMRPTRPGLTYEVVLNALKTAGLLYPGEIVWMGTCAYWDRTKEPGMSTFRVREQIYKIVGELWPNRLLGNPPTWHQFEAMLPDPFQYLVNEEHMTPQQASKMCPKLAKDSTSTVAELLAEASVAAMQPNKLWSIVHFFTFNLIDLQITQDKALASQALATLLAQNFWCNDCRSFFQVGVIEQFGMPPLTSGMDIAHWWHHAHNTASEHVATTRAGHPWIHQLDALKDYQNPFYMSWEDAYSMWHVPVEIDLE